MGNRAGTVEVDVEPGMVGFGERLARGVSQANISPLSKEMTRIGNKMTASLTLPIALGFGFAFAEAQEAAKVGAQTNAVIASTGHAANVTANEVGTLAQRLSEKVAIDDEAIQSGENLLLTFKNIRNEAGKGNDVFTQATKLTLDMSVAMGTDMRSSALQVGKALNDPVRGMTALGRAGVQFTDQQKEQIKTLVESGDLLGAQKIILKELAQEFEGSAEAAATPFDRLKVRAQNFAEEVGTRAMPVLEDFFGIVETGFDLFEGLPDWAKTFTLGGVAVLGATGPMLKFGGALLGVYDRLAAGGPAAQGFATGIRGIGGAALGAGGAALGLAALGMGLAEATGQSQGFRLEMHGNEIAVDQLGSSLSKLNDQALVRTFTRLTVLSGVFSELPGPMRLFRDVAEANIGTAQRLITNLDAQGVKTGRYKEILVEVIAEQRRVTADTEAGATAYGGMASSLTDASTAADDFKSSLDDLLGINLDVEQANIGYQQSFADLNTSLIDNGTTLDINTEKGRSNRQAILDSTGAVLTLASAMVRQTGDTDAANFAITQHVARLTDVMRQAGMTDAEIQAYLATLGLTPDQVSTLVQQVGAEGARGAIDELNAAIVRVPKDVVVTVSAMVGGPNARIGPGGVLEVNFGFGWVPIAARERGGPIPGPPGTAVPILAHGGEYVLDAETVDRIKKGKESAGSGRALGALAAAPGGGGGDSLLRRWERVADALDSAAASIAAAPSVAGAAFANGAW